jgi:hypothetical protein
MSKYLTKEDEEMIIYARKYLHDALECIDYSDTSSKERIKKCMEWISGLKTRL